jgi:PAS domain-containing protein
MVAGNPDQPEVFGMNQDLYWLGLVVLGGALVVALIGFAYLLLRLREAELRLQDKEDQHQGILDRLQENEYRLRTIIESEPECVKLQAEDGTVLEINPAGLRLVDANSPADIIGTQDLSMWWRRNTSRHLPREHAARLRRRSRGLRVQARSP